MLASSPAWAAGSAAPGWRIVPSGQRPGVVLTTVTAIDQGDAWAGGGNVQTSAGKPFVEHWRGHRWLTSSLPAGLSGAVEVLRASAWNNVWAFGATNQDSGGFALRWNGHRWLLMKRFSVLTSVAGAVVLGPANVWVFSAVGGALSPLWHFDGHTWQFVNFGSFIIWFDSATVLPSGDIWAVGNAGGPGPAVLHGTPSGGNYTWQTTVLTGLPQPRAGDLLTDIFAVSSREVWVLGGNVKIVHGHDHWYPLAERWDGQAWHQVPVSGTFTLAGGSAASDGHGGLWVTTGFDSTARLPHILHFTGGKFIGVTVAGRTGMLLSVFSLANIPRSASVWGAGTDSGPGAPAPETGEILKHGL